MDRRLSVDILKILLAVMVVGIHANPFKGLFPDAVTLTGQGLFRLGVPTFFVINGYFFQPVVMSGGAGRYVRHVLFLYLAWTALYAWAWWGILGNPDPMVPLRVLLTGWWHLWYLQALAIAALILWAIRRWPTPVLAAIMVLGWAAGVAIVYALAFDALADVGRISGDPTSLHRNALCLGLPFMLAGFLIRRHNLTARIPLPVAAGLAAASVAGVLAESLWLAHAAPKGVGHDNLIALGLAAPALFLLAMQFPQQARSRNLGTYANGIYFLHVAFCVIGFRWLKWDSLPIYLMAVTGSVAVTWAMIRGGLAKRLL
jgi:surface polysaccharide O-acyltransferase-like enzyme